MAYIAIIATILAVTLWYMDSAAALKCNDYTLESLLTGYLDKDSVHWRGGQYMNVWSSAHWEGRYTGDASFLKLTNKKQPKTTCSISD